jgi:hypothetical protein
LWKHLSRWRDHWDLLEAILGLIAVFALTWGPAALASLAVIVTLVEVDWAWFCLAILITAITVPMAIWIKRMSESAMQKFRSSSRIIGSDDADPDSNEDRRRIPFAILLVGELPRLQRKVRIPLAIWWLAHFTVAAAFIYFSGQALRQRNPGQGFGEGIPIVLLCFAFQFAANVFLVLSVAVGFRSPKITAEVWKKRFLIDAVLTLPVLLELVL